MNKTHSFMKTVTAEDCACVAQYAGKLILINGIN